MIQIETIDQGRIWVTVGAPSKKGPEVDLKREPFENMEWDERGATVVRLAQKTHRRFPSCIGPFVALP